MGISKKSFVSLFLSFSLVLSLISVLFVQSADAKTVRVAVIASLSGDVTVKKGGGSKSYDAYESMSLNQGDTVYTGAESSVTLNLSNGDADVTLGENAELNVSDLNSSDGNRKSKLKVWAGSLWVKVKSLAGSNDEFEVETPTAVMGVRGTQFYVAVDPNTGAIKMAVGAGKVSASTVNNGSDDEQSTSITYLYPTQQITLDSRDETEDLGLKVNFMDLETFVKEASPEVIEEFIRNKAEIDKENEEFIAKKKQELADGKITDDQNLVLKNQEELDKVKQNFDNLVGNVAKKALAENKIDKSTLDKIIEETNNKITDSDKKLDLSKVKDLDVTAGTDPVKEKAKQDQLKKLEEEKLKVKLENEKKEADLKKKLEAVLKQLEEAKKKTEAAVKEAAEKAKAEAEAKLKQGMSDQEKKDFDDKKSASSQNPGNSKPGGSTNPGNDDPAPKTPAITVVSTTINESSRNDGSIDEEQVINLSNGTFAQDLSTGVTVNNLPSGLTAKVARISNTQISISFNGQAAAHASANSVSNASVTIAKDKIIGASNSVSSGVFQFKFMNSAPSVSLQAVSSSDPGAYNLNINLANFEGNNDIYAVEVHLLYGENTYFNNEFAPVNGTIFGRNNDTNYADYVKEYAGSDQKELVYAITNFGAAGNIEVTGAPQTLVTIPFRGFNEQTITVGKIVIVRKDGTAVQTIPINESAIEPATITLSGGEA